MVHLSANQKPVILSEARLGPRRAERVGASEAKDLLFFYDLASLSPESLNLLVRYRHQLQPGRIVLGVPAGDPVGASIGGEHRTGGKDG